MADGLLATRLDNPLTNLGIGLLSASGPSLEPRSFATSLGKGLQFAQDAKSRQLKNQIIRDRLTGEKRKRAASERLKGLLAAEGGDSELLGLLAEISPGSVAQNLTERLLPQPRAETSLVRNLRAAKIDPASPEGQKIMRQHLVGTGTSEQLDQTLKLLQVQALADEQREARTEKQRKEAGAKLSVVGGIDRLREVADINQRLKGTLGETGIGLDEARSAAAGGISTLTTLLGGDAGKARQVAADLQRFGQLTTTEAMSSLFSGEVTAGTITDTKLQTFLQTKPGVGVLPEVNDKIVADMLQSKLDSAEKLGIAVQQREAIEAQIKQLRGTRSAPRGPDPKTLQGLSRRAGRAITESDVRETMQKRDMTRQQVLDELDRRLPNG